MKKTIIDLFEDSVGKYGGKTFLLEKRHHRFEPTTYAETRELALEVGAGLAASGIRPGDKVAILAEGSNAWIISELGLFYAGAVSVPLSVKLEESNDLLFRLRHAEVKALFVSKHQLPKIRRIRAELPQIELVVVFGHIALEAGETAYGTLRKLGRDYLAKHREEFLKIGQAIRNDDYATITYTSGTTADPKGVILTHRNYTANVEQSLTRIDIPPYYRTLIILPLDHCFAHVVGFYIMIACGATVATVQIGRTPMETLKNIPVNIREVRPHFLLSVPALAKNFRKSIESSIRAKGRMTEGLFRLALKTAYAYNGDGYRRGRGWRCVLRPVVALFDVTLFRKVRKAFGGELRFFVGGERCSMRNCSGSTTPSVSRCSRVTASRKRHPSSRPTRPGPANAASARRARWYSRSTAASSTKRVAKFLSVREAKSSSAARMSWPVTGKTPKRRPTPCATAGSIRATWAT